LERGGSNAVGRNQLIVNKNTMFYDDRKPEAATAV
jgi:hypothetical protein